MSYEILRQTTVNIPDGYGGADKPLTIRLILNEDSTNQSANTSYVSLRSIGVNLWGSAGVYACQWSGWVKVNGQVVWQDSYVTGRNVDIGAWWTDFPGTVGGTTVAHNADGSKVASVEWDLGFRLYWNGHRYFGTTSSDGITLTKFVFANSVSAADGNIEEESNITVNKVRPEYYYSLEYVMAAETDGTRKAGFIDGSGNHSTTEVKIRLSSGGSKETIPFSIPESFYSAIPKNQFGYASIFCRTYSNASSDTPLDFNVVKAYYYGGVFYAEASHSTPITPTTDKAYFDLHTDRAYLWDGTAYQIIVGAFGCYCSFQARASEALSRPTATGSVVDINEDTIALTGDDSVLVKYFSTAEVTFNASARKQASLVTKRINNISVPLQQTVYDYELAELSSYNLVATDTRGYSNETLIVPSVPRMINYVKLTNNAVVSRRSATDNVVTVNFTGNFFTQYDEDLDAYKGGYFGEPCEENPLTIKYRYKVAGGNYNQFVSVTPTFYDGHYTAFVELNNLSYLNQYVFNIVVEDALMKFDIETAVTRGLPIFDWGADDFNINGNFSVTALGGSTGNAKIDRDLSVNGQIYYGEDEYEQPIPIEDTYPTELPTPNSLSWNIFGEEGSFDGSEEKNISVPMPNVFIDEIARPRYGNSSQQYAFDVYYDASKNYKSFAIAYFGWASGDAVPSMTFIQNGTAGDIIAYYDGNVGRTYNAVNNGVIQFGDGFLRGSPYGAGNACLICGVYGIRVG